MAGSKRFGHSAISINLQALETTVTFHRTVVVAALFALTTSAFAQELRGKSIEGAPGMQSAPGDPNAPAPVPANTPAGIISIYGIANGGVEYTKPAGQQSKIGR